MKNAFYRKLTKGRDLVLCLMYGLICSEVGVLGVNNYVDAKDYAMLSGKYEVIQTILILVGVLLVVDSLLSMCCILLRTKCLKGICKIATKFRHWLFFPAAFSYLFLSALISMGEHIPPKHAILVSIFYATLSIFGFVLAMIDGIEDNEKLRYRDGTF